TRNVQVVVALRLVAFAASASPLAEESRPRSPPRAEVASSEDTAQLSYIAAESISARNTGEKSFSAFLSEERDVVGSAALLVNTDLRLMPRLTIQAGPQAYVALLSEENEDVAALSLGVRALLELDR